MKNRIALMLVIVLVLPMVLAACGEFSEDDLIGSWELKGDPSCTFNFYEDRSGKMAVEREKYSDHLFCSWRLQGDTLTLKDNESGYYFVFTIRAKSYNEFEMSEPNFVEGYDKSQTLIRR